MIPKLRKKEPYFCRTVDASGKHTCLALLTQPEGDYCPPCADRMAQAKARFLAPVVVESSRGSLPDNKPHWPFWPGA